MAEDLEALNEVVRLSGRQAVPVITVGGEVIVGFDRGSLQELLKL